MNPITIPANKVAEFLTAKNPERKKRILRQIKYGKKGHPIFYTLFHGAGKRFLINGARDATQIMALIAKLQLRVSTDWYKTDSRITTEALRALVKLGPKLARFGGTFVPAGKDSKTKLVFGDVQISTTPNLLVHGERAGKPLVGALRFYIAKESTYELGKRGAEYIAVMEYEWLKQISSGARAPDPELCIVVECFQQRITTVPENFDESLAYIERGCREISALWHLLDDDKAA